VKGRIVNLTSICIAATLGAVTALSPAVLASEAGPNSLAKCAALLPAGQSYSYVMRGTIDTRSGKPVLEGSFTVDDGTQRDRHDDNVGFGRCVASLIGA
jgi:hypothetical protein